MIYTGNGPKIQISVHFECRATPIGPVWSRNTAASEYTFSSQKSIKSLKIPRTFRERSENTIDSVSNYKNPSICSRIDLLLKFHRKYLHKKVLSKFWSTKKTEKKSMESRDGMKQIQTETQHLLPHHHSNRLQPVHWDET